MNSNNINNDNVKNGMFVEANSLRWYKDGALHRENDLPAIEWYDGSYEWYENGQRHRNNAPAVIYLDGRQGWYQHGELHREDGPAYERPSVKIKEWWIHGEEYSLKEFNAYLAKKQLHESLHENLKEGAKPLRNKV